MRKYLLFIISMLCVSIGAWANPVAFGTNSTYEIDGSTITINVGTRGDLASWTTIPSLTGITTVKVTGIIGSKQNASEDNNSIANGWGSDGMALKNFASCILDLSGATMPIGTYQGSPFIVIGENTSYSKNVLVPSEYASDPSTFPASQAYGSISSNTINLYSINGSNLKAALGDLNTANIAGVKGSCTTLEVYNFSSGNLDSSGFTTIDFTNTTLTGTTNVPTGATVYVNTVDEKSYITGTNVNVQARFNGTATVAAGGNLGTNITSALNGYEANNNLSNITTLNITGQLTEADVTWLNTNKSSLTGLKTVNLTGLSGLGSGVSKSTIAAALPTGVTVNYPPFFYSSADGVNTFNVLEQGSITSAALTAKGINNLTGTTKIIGDINTSDISSIIAISDWDARRFDFSEATITGSMPRFYHDYLSPYRIILPAGSSAPTDEEVAYTSDEVAQTTNGIYNPYGDLKYIIIPASEEGGHAKIFVNNPKNNEMATAIDSYDISVINANNPSVIDVYNLNGAFDAANFTTLQNSINSTWTSPKTIVYHATMNPMVITGCNVTIDMNEANGKSLATLISEAKAEVDKTIPTGICSLTINGPLSADDITALNTAMGTGEDLASITTLNLGGATGMAQTAVDALAIPETLTRLTIPADRIVDGSLKTTLATSKFDNLTYVYSPSSDSQKPGKDQESLFDRTKNLVADYVWVNRQNALPTAFTNEEQLRNSYNIKVASSVALTDTDVNFAALGDNKPSNYLFLNFSDANLTPAVAASYTVTDNIGYRIILPNNWTGDQMAVFAANPHCGNLAAVYSYNGTKLNIMEIKDGSYSPAALADPRIVRAGTTEVNVISGTYNGETYANFGDNLLAALNNMGKSEFDYNSSHYNNTVGLTVTKVSIETGSNVPNAITFNNPTIQTLELKNVGQGWSSLDVACSSLQTLNLNHINLGNVSAKVPAASPKTGLTSINLSGATINGSADFSTSPLTSAFTMDDDTYITSNLLLKSTELTSFTPQGTIGGDIYLNASDNLASLDVRQFTQAATKKIHIDADATENESNTDVIDALEVANAVTVPSDYVIADHFHPVIADTYVKREAYVPPMYTTSTTTMVLHEKNANTDGDNFIYWYDDPTNQGTNVTLGTSTESGHSLAEILTSEASNLNFGTTTYRRAKIDGPITSTDIASLASINCQVLDLSSATFDEDAWTALKNAFKTSGTNIHSNVRFVILPSNSTREDIINGTALAGLTNVLSVIALNKITGATDASDNGTNLTSWNRVSGALQAAVVAAGNHSCQSWTKTIDEETSRNIYTSDISDFRECKISGLINSYDLSKANQNLDANGHLSWDKEPVELSSGTDPRKLNGACTAYGPFSASFNLSVIDLQGAFFEEKGNNTGLADKDKRYYFQDMTLSALGIISDGTYKVVVPTDPRAKEIPADFMNCSTNIRAICIPSNIVAIRTRAFYTIDYVWTTATNLADTEDPEGDNTKLDNGAKLKIKDGTTYSADGSDFIKTSALTYENGAYKENPAFTKKCYVADYGTINGGGTYTFGSNLRMIETGAFANTQPNVKDVYVLNTKAPECHVDAFNTVMYTGNGGYNPTAVEKEGIIKREAYYNGRWITMLHYPRQTTTPNVQRYTDPTRDYSIATGERDGKGAIIYFPNQSEFIRAYMQGTYGYVWNAWNPTRTYGNVTNEPLTNTTSGWKAENQTSANTLFNNYATGANHKYTSFYKVSGFTGENVTAPTAEIVPYNQVNWNETSYSTATPGNLYPQSEIDANSDADNSGEKTTKDYRGWHQFVLNAYAANTVLEEEPYRSYITDNEWWTICPEFDITKKEAIILFGTPEGYAGATEDKLPYVSKLRYVRRMYGENGNNSIFLNFSDNLMAKKEKRTSATDQHGVLDGNGVMITEGETGDDDVVMSAGVPYMIKPNLTVAAGNSYNRQFRVLTSTDYAKLTQEQREGSSPRYIESNTLYNKIKEAQSMSGADQRNLIKTGTYTVPVFVGGRDNAIAKGYTVENVEMDGSKAKTYKVGEVEGYNKSTDWHYTFVGTFYKSFLPHYSYFLGWDSSKNCAKFYYHNGNFNAIDNQMRWANGTGIIVPVKSTDLVDGKFKYSVSVAEDMKTPAQWKLQTTFTDDSFTTTGNSPRMFSMDFNSPDVTSTDNGTTMIEGINVNEDAYGATGNVYSLEGRKVGNSLQGLPKGVYIMNGKKYVVK